MLIVFVALALFSLFIVVRRSGLTRLSAFCSFVVFCVAIAHVFGFLPGLFPWF